MKTITISMPRHQADVIAHWAQLAANRATTEDRRARWRGIRDTFARADEVTSEGLIAITLDAQTADTLTIVIVLQLRELEGDTFDLFSDFHQRLTTELDKLHTPPQH